MKFISIFFVADFDEFLFSQFCFLVVQCFSIKSKPLKFIGLCRMVIHEVIPNESIVVLYSMPGKTKISYIRQCNIPHKSQNQVRNEVSTRTASVSNKLRILIYQCSTQFTNTGDGRFYVLLFTIHINLGRGGATASTTWKCRNPVDDIGSGQDSHEIMCNHDPGQSHLVTGSRK